MRILLDTCAFLWLEGHQDVFGAAALKVFNGTEDSLVLSIASVWEIAIKRSHGKLDRTRSLFQLVDSYRRKGSLELLAVNLHHLDIVESLPLLHRDPFDRIIAAQAIHEHLPIISSDKIFDGYGVRRIW